MSIPTLLSIQVGKPAVHGADNISDKPWESGIFKYPVQGRVWLATLNLEGDGQQDTRPHVHGGPFRAVLAYSADHYPAWRAQLNLTDMPFGAFGENFTIAGMTEETVCIGDVYAVGQTRVRVSQPRQPCWKLARRWGIKDLTARVDEVAHGGWYHQVLREGYVEAGDSYQLLERTYPKFTVSFVYALMKERIDDDEAASELATLPELSDGWREGFAEQVAAR